MEIYFYSVGCADAGRIRYQGTDGLDHNILIDSGYPRAYRNILANEIKSIITNSECIDLWILTHIHSDHIGGAVSYINAIKKSEIKDIVKSWYYNAPRQGISGSSPLLKTQISEAASITQADTITTYLNSINMLPAHEITNELAVQNIYGLELTILSPSNTELVALREKYRSVETELETIESISEPTATKKTDYHICVSNFDLSGSGEDRSLENGSSIAFLANYNGKMILWLSDAHPSVIINSLKKLGYSKANRLKCDWVKISHHGSKDNNNCDLYELIECSNYLFSVDGINNHDYIPSKECIVKILRCPNRDMSKTIRLYFTNDDKQLRNIFAIDDDQVFQRWNFEVEFISTDYLNV